MTDGNPKLAQRINKAEDARNDLIEPESSAKQPLRAKLKSEPHDDAQLLSRTAAGESDRDRRKRERATRLSQESDFEMKDAPPGLPAPVPQRAAPAPKAMPAPATPATQNSLEAPDATSHPVQVFLELLEEIFSEASSVGKITQGHVHSRMYIKCSTVYHALPEVSHFYAKQLAASLPPKWHQTAYFQWLLSISQEPWEGKLTTADTIAGNLIRRKRKNNTSKARPRDSEGAGTPHMGKRLPATPRTGALTLKRPRPSHYEGDDGRYYKHARTSSGASEDENSEEEPVNDSSDPAAARAYPFKTTPIPPQIPKETVPIVVRAEKIPTVSPTGPNGAWRCDEDGCDYIVRAAEEPEGKALIDEHFQDHAQRVAKVNLALAEGTRGNLPIRYVIPLLSISLVK